MGNVYASYIKSPDGVPDIKVGTTFDPLYGFPNGRTERQMKVTEEQMEAAGVLPEHRDFCAHHLIELKKCRHENFPWVLSCKHEKHMWEECQHNDFVLRMKEFERERRLLERANKLKRQQQTSEVLAG